jgi:hypothetical protein
LRQLTAPRASANRAKDLSQKGVAAGSCNPFRQSAASSTLAKFDHKALTWPRSQVAARPMVRLEVAPCSSGAGWSEAKRRVPRHAFGAAACDRLPMHALALRRLTDIMAAREGKAIEARRTGAVIAHLWQGPCNCSVRGVRGPPGPAVIISLHNKRRPLPARPG